MVNSEDAIKFKAFMQVDKHDFNMSRPSHPMYYDREMGFYKDRSFWLIMILSLLGGAYIYKKLFTE